MEKSKKHNLKYYCSEGAAVGIALTTSALTAYLTDKITDSNAIISGTSAIGGTIGWILGNIGIYGFLHREEYKKGERNFKYDMKSIFRSNIEGIATTYSVRIPLQYVLQKYFGVEPPVAALISHISGGVGGTVVRWVMNYKRKIFGDEKTDKTKVQKCKNLEDLFGLELDTDILNIEKRFNK